MRLLKYILSVILPTFALSYLALLFVNSGLKKQQNDFFGTFNHIADNSDKHDILIFGASIAKNNINPRVIDSVSGKSSFNCGIYGFGFVDSKILLESYLHSPHPKPTTVVYVMQPDWGRPRGHEITYAPQFYPYASNNAVYETGSKYDDGIKLVKYLPFVALSKYNDHLKYSSLIPFVKKDHLRKGNYLGYEPIYGTVMNLKRFENATNIIIEKDSKETSPVQQNNLEDFCKVCTDNNIKLLLVFPCSYTTKIDTTVDRSFPALHKIVDKYNVSIVDYANSEMNMVKSNFFDLYHLNNIGADKFSELLAKDILKGAN